MTWLDWVAGLVLCLQMPIPLFWLSVHPFVGFWRRRPRLAYIVALPCAWLLVAALLYAFRDRLFASREAPPWAIVLGLALVLGDACFVVRVHRELGGLRLFGFAELAGGGTLAEHGLYARVRHPRYTSMITAVLGACLIAATLLLWIVAAAWWLLAILAVFLEERELRARFGQAYLDYARRVPRFLPFRFWPPER
jgi:protein-S-isoprenylcysteine O-methyltransferase Ste14